jgi:hypothetical protein
MKVLNLNITRFVIKYYGDKRNSYFTMKIFSFVRSEVLTAVVYKEFSLLGYIAVVL